MTSRRRHLAIVLVMILALVAGREAGAGAPTDQLRTQIERVLKTVEDPELKKAGKANERREAVRRVAAETFDFTEMSKRALARHWQARTPAEREEFVKLFADLLERAYVFRIENYGGERIAYNGDTIEGDVALVRTKIITKQGTDVPVDYRMLKRNDRWLAYDVVIEGVGLINNYRTQFNKIIQTSSYQALVDRMKNKQIELLQDDKKS
ncbi:MAG: MlaC/ttg2D family ABC transporter substrate-binding protein [Candidatus Rokuibacteriota bacterium]